MNREEVKKVLQVYRPWANDQREPEIQAALQLARRDPELRDWLDRELAFQTAVRSRLRAVEPPPDLKQRVLARGKVSSLPVWWQRPGVWAAAAAVALLLAVAAIWNRAPAPDRFTNYQERMAGTALRQYGMDLETSDMNQLRAFVQARGGPADYAVPPGLARLQLTGGGLLRWRNNPVTMVCFDRGDRQMLFLFVMKRAAVKDPPPETPQVGRKVDLTTVSWSQGGNTYFLAGPAEPDFVKKYL
ncbi:MAG TPA: hypothetical protein P5038_18050 [Candidatus Paceibacterota bacterium]|nr:hypothetical protein [Candidatus Paceibacterota bacterium]